MEGLKRARSQFLRVVLLIGVFSLVVNMLLLVMPLYMLQIYDRILPSRSMDTLTFLSIIAGGSLIVLGLLEAVRAVLASRAAARLETELGADALRVSMRLSGLGEADIQPVRDLSKVALFIASRSVFALFDLPFAPLFIGILFFIHPTLFYLTVAGAVVLLMLAVFNQWVTARAAGAAGGRQLQAMTMAQSIARNSETLRAMGMSNNGINLWGGHNSESLISHGVVDSRNAVLTGLSRTVRMGLQIAILGVGALLVLRNEMTAGMIFAASIISGRGLQPIDQVIGGWRQFSDTWRSWRSFSMALQKVPAEPQRTSLPPPKGDVSAQAALVVAAGGMSRPPILNRVNFELKAGRILGIVGPSGSGKSTLARLMVGAQKPEAGTIRIDGTDIQNWDPIQLGQHIGYLGQNVELLPGTIKENIARLSTQPDDAAVLEAAQKARVHELIQSLPDGYDTRVGAGGTGLSGGQKQRIALARAFYGNPQIMVLDEPNANLDDDGELALQKAILVAREAGVTVAIVTQRKQILAIVDDILRLRRGSVDFFGTRDAFVAALQKMRDQSQEKQLPAGQPVQRAQKNPQLASSNKPAQKKGEGTTGKRELPGSPFPPAVKSSTKFAKKEDNPYSGTIGKSAGGTKSDNEKKTG